MSADGGNSNARKLNEVSGNLQHHVDVGNRYTCPMCPSVVQEGPGDCPMCGMALEPVDILNADQGENPELTDFRQRLKWGLGFLTPLFIISMSSHLGWNVLEGLATARQSLWIELGLASPIVLWVGWPFLLRGGKSVVRRNFNMFTLIAMGVATAYVFSIAATLAPEQFPPGFRQPDGSVSVYFEAAAMIVVLVLVGQIMELHAREKTGSAIRKLLDLNPQTARRVLPDGNIEDIPVCHLAVGDKLRIKPGDKIPTDGMVLDGQSGIDESMISGEPAEVHKIPGDPVTGATINGNGSLLVEVTKVGKDTLLSQIIALTIAAQRTRAPAQRLVDSVSKVFVPTVVLIAALSFVGWMYWGPDPALAYGIVSAVSVLVIACPCALGLATPMAIMTAVGRGARAGVLIKEAAALEQFANVDTLVIDKTGTLSEGKPCLTSVLPVNGFAQTEVLGMAMGLEQQSEHPLADAIVSGAAARNVNAPKAVAFKAVSGKGVQGLIAGKQILVGNAKFLNRNGISCREYAHIARARSEKGETVVYVSLNQQIAGLISVSDQIKPTTRKSLTQLTGVGTRVIMVTGDDTATAESIGGNLGITEIHAGVLPAEKAEIVKDLQLQGRIVAMAGDGINDAPALAQADVGIAMGNGTDVAIESADITLVKGDLSALVRARNLSTATVRNIKQNLFLAMVYNALSVPVAAGVLYPVFGILISPIFSAAAMSLSSVCVIANALRLRTQILDRRTNF